MRMSQIAGGSVRTSSPGGHGNLLWWAHGGRGWRAPHEPVWPTGGVGWTSAGRGHCWLCFCLDLYTAVYLGVQFPSDWRQMLPQNRVG
jgi:hypothetical protein